MLSKMSLLWWVDLQDLEFLLWLSPGGVTTGLVFYHKSMLQNIFSLEMVVVPGQWWGVWNVGWGREECYSWFIISIGMWIHWVLLPVVPKKKKKKINWVFTDNKGLICNSWRISKTVHSSQELYLIKMNLFWLDAVVVLEGPRLRSPALIIFRQNRSKYHICK